MLKLLPNQTFPCKYVDISSRIDINEHFFIAMIPDFHHYCFLAIAAECYMFNGCIACVNGKDDIHCLWSHESGTCSEPWNLITTRQAELARIGD
jgi:hypothetical protein